MNSHRTEVKDTATFTWTVPRFSKQNGMHDSYEFSTKSQRFYFSLRLDSNGKLFDGLCNNNSVNLAIGDNYVKIYMFCVNEPPLVSTTVRCIFSILDNHENKKFTQEYTFVFDDYNYANDVHYIQSADCAQFLVNDTLKLHCEVDILDENNMQNLPPTLQLNSAVKAFQDYRVLLESGKLSDFSIIIGGKKLHIHKAILAARSAVFAAMFEHSETKEAKEGQMVIKDSDMSVEVCELMIRYIYCGEIEMLDKYAAELFVAADMYQLDHLKSICEQFLIVSIETESVCSFEVLADLHNAHELKSKCIQFMIDNYAQVMATEGWKQLMATNRMDLLAELFKISASLAK